jgi:hypothetical protein
MKQATSLCRFVWFPTFADRRLVPFHNKETTASQQAFHLTEVD